MGDIIPGLDSAMRNAHLSDGHPDPASNRSGSENNLVPQDNPSSPDFNQVVQNIAQYQEDESDDDENIVTIQAAGLQPQSRSSMFLPIPSESLY
jgi:hypothetical protein